MPQDAPEFSVAHPVHDMVAMGELVREGRFQRSLALVTAGTSLLGGLEVAYEHYKGSYSRRVMYTPVILAGVLGATAIAGFRSGRAARTWLRGAAAITLIDSGVGFYFHVRGVHRKPGGWSLPMTNMIMGPPIFAPLLFGVSAYLGLIASFLRREDDDTHRAPAAPRAALSEGQDLREGRFQQQVAVATGLVALLSGFEAFYSHYKNNFRYRAQWTPVVIAPLLAATAFASVRAPRLATTALPALSVVAGADAAAGFFYHARGILRRPGGRKRLGYNILYGPPIFAPLLFGAAALLGVMASLLRRKPKAAARRALRPAPAPAPQLISH